jgi:hypothetical protein
MRVKAEGSKQKAGRLGGWEAERLKAIRRLRLRLVEAYGSESRLHRF